MTHRAPSNPFPALLALLILVAACSSDGGTGPGGLRSVHVSVTTEGDDLDQDGYTVTLGSDTRTVGSSGAATFQGLPPGDYHVSLDGLAPNCTVDGEPTRSVTVTQGADASVSFDVTCWFDAAGETLEVMTCPALAPAVLEGMPLDEVSLAGVPSGLERPLWARMSWDGGALVSQGLVQEEGGELTMMIPLHPSASAEGGDVTVRISDEEHSCPPFDFRILPLPAASGELAAVADVVQDLLDQHTVLFGTTREDLLGTPIPEMEPALVPLAVAHAIMDGASDESLRSYAAGAVPDFTSEDLDLLERLVARTGLRADLEAELVAVLTDGSAARAGASLPSPARAFSPGVALDCITSTTLDAAALDECMTLARDKVQGAASEKTQGAAMLAMDIAALLGSRKIAKPIGSLLTVSKLYDQAVAGILPSSFVSIDVTLNPAEFMEDEAGPGTWAPARVMATSTGWNLEDLTAELIAGRISPGSGLPFKVPRLTFRQKRGLKAAYPEVASALSDAVDIENFFLGMREQLVNALVGLGVTELSDGSLAVGPRQFGPVDVTDTEWSDARIVTGTSVVLTSHEQYDPREPGRSLLEVVTAVGKFGGTSIRTDHLPITVNQLEVTISPTEVALPPEQPMTFTVTVANSKHPASIEIVRGSGFQGEAELALGEGNTHTVHYTAPLNPIPNSTDLLQVRHTAESGARGHSSVERASAVATIRFGTFRITTEGRCVEPGSPGFQIEVDHDGLVDPEWVWTATAGDISDTGFFTPPTQSGLVTISVALASNPDLEQSLSLQIGGCSCLGTINVGGETAATTDMRFRLSPDLSGVESFSWRGEGISDVGFWFGSDYLNPELEVVPLNTTGQFEGMTQGLVNAQLFANPDDINEPTIAPLTILISDNTGSILAGVVSGSVSVSDDPEPRIVPFTFDFHIEADPILSDDVVKFCEVPE